MARKNRKRKVNQPYQSFGSVGFLQLPSGIKLGSAMNLPTPLGSTQHNATNSQIDEPDDEAMVVAETYADYWPVKLTFGKKHPDAVVETASLSSVSPTDIQYQLAIPEQTIDDGKLSALQLESIIYASQAHEQLLPDGSRAGFLIGTFFHVSLIFVVNDNLIWDLNFF